MSMQDRPARPGRTKPVPTSDAGVDPVDYRPKVTPATEQVTTRAVEPPQVPVTEKPKDTSAPPSATSQSQTNSNALSGPQATVQLGVNVHPDIAQLVARVKSSTGLSKRAIVEKALLDAWGDKS